MFTGAIFHTRSYDLIPSAGLIRYSRVMEFQLSASSIGEPSSGYLPPFGKGRRGVVL